MGDALDTLTLRELADAVRAGLGERGDLLSHTCDVITVEICRSWPERAMADLARDMSNGDAVLGALDVVTAKVRETIEARWKCRAAEKQALDLVLRGCVVEFAKLWFSCPEARIGMRVICEMIRLGKLRLD